MNLFLGVGEDARLVTSNDGMCVARQNGKGVIEQAIEVFFAFELGYRVVMHTAHEFATSQEHQLRLEAFIQDDPSLHKRVKAKGGYMHANGRESINLKSGARIIFKARTKGGGRGYSGDLLVWDEAMIIPHAVVGAQKPMLRSSQAPFGQKTIYAGSAVDQQVHEHGVPFALIRERGMERSPGVSWVEWSAPFGHPSEMPIEVLRDRSWWSDANPSMSEGLIAESYMAEEIESMIARTSAVELGNVGDWPSTDDRGESPITAEMWRAIVDEASVVENPVWFALDSTPDRSATCIAAAGRRADGLGHFEVVDYRPQTGWAVPRLLELVREHKPAGVVVDGRGPAAAFVDQLAAEGVMVTVTSSQEYAQACGLFFDAVAERNARHLGTAELTSAARGAAQRPLGDAWAWSRKTSAADISPLVAATLALWAATKATVDAWVGW